MTFVLIRCLLLTIIVLGLFTTDCSACIYGRWGFDPDKKHQQSATELFRVAEPQDTMKAAEAREELKQIAEQVKSRPDDLMLLNDYAYLLNRTGDKATVEKILLGILKTHPDHFPTICNLATYYEQWRRYGDAETLLKKAAALRPEFRSRAEQYHIAKIEYDKTVAANTQFAYSNIFIKELTPVWAKRGDPEHNFSTIQFPDIQKDGIAELEHQFPRFGEGWLVLGMLLEHDKDYGNALIAYKKAVATGTAHMSELKRYLKDFEPFAQEHNTAHDIARRIKWLLIILLAGGVGYWLLKTFANVVFDITSHNAEKRKREKSKKKMGIPPPEDL